MNYVLVKNLPGTPAGTLFQKQGNVYQVGKPTEHGIYQLHEKIVENQPEWFVPEGSRPANSDDKAISGPPTLPVKRGRPAGSLSKKSRK
jgi:hypothetical protein